MKIGKTLFITVMLLFTVILLIGGGHGTFLPAKIIYPFTMLIAIISKNGIGVIPTIIAILQVPLYSLILSKKPKWKYFLIGIHIIAVIVCLNLTNEIFD